MPITRRAATATAHPNPVAALDAAKHKAGVKRKALDPILNQQEKAVSTKNISIATATESAGSERLKAKTRPTKSLITSKQTVAARAVNGKVAAVPTKVAASLEPKNVLSSSSNNSSGGSNAIAKKLKVHKDAVLHPSAKQIKKTAALVPKDTAKAKVADISGAASKTQDKENIPPSVNSEAVEVDTHTDKENVQPKTEIAETKSELEAKAEEPLFSKSSKVDVDQQAKVIAQTTVVPPPPLTQSQDKTVQVDTAELPKPAIDDRQALALEEVLRAPRVRFPATRPAEDWTDLDAVDEFDPIMVAEYVEDCMEYMRKIELETLPMRDYLIRQKDLDSQMRMVLIDWIVEVHSKFHLLPETLFLAVNLVDRFLSVKPVSVSKLQLVGIAALVIASKYEEIYAPTIENFAYMADNGFDRKEILSAERFVLKVLKFKLKYPNPLHFLRRASKADAYDLKNRTMAKYILESILLDESFIGVPQSLAAAAALYISIKVLKKRECWNVTMTHYAGYSIEQLRPIALQILHHLERTAEAASDAQSAVFRKYSHKRTFCVARRAARYVLANVESEDFGFTWEDHEELDDDYVFYSDNEDADDDADETAA